MIAQNSFGVALIMIAGLLTARIEGCSGPFQPILEAISEGLNRSPELRLLAFLGKKAGREPLIIEETPKQQLDDWAAGIHGISKDERQKLQVDCIVSSITLTGPIANREGYERRDHRIEVQTKPSHGCQSFDTLMYWAIVQSDADESEAFIDCQSVVSEGSTCRLVKSSLRARYDGETWIEVDDDKSLKTNEPQDK